MSDIVGVMGDFYENLVNSECDLPISTLIKGKGGRAVLQEFCA